MAELLPSTSDKTPTEKVGLGLLIDHAFSNDPTASACQNVEIPRPGSDSPAAVVEGSNATDEELDLLKALERDLYQLTIEQAEIETGRERPGAVNEDEERGVGEMKADVLESQNGLSYVGDEGRLELNDLREEKSGENAERFEDENVLGYLENEGTLKLDNLWEGNVVNVEGENVNGWGFMGKEKEVKLDTLYEEKGGKKEQSFGDGNENDRWDYIKNVRLSEESERGKSGDAAMRFGRSNQGGDSMMINYPMRPDADDCTFYMKFGSCKFGASCKFNHPLRRKNQGAKERANPSEENSERARQTECKYYLTSAGCRYGKDCKYSHGSDKSYLSHHNLEFNFLGLPIRPEEKECSYYMRTGTCKYGSNCRFHHPEPTTVVDTDSPPGFNNGSSIPSQLVPSSSWSPPKAFHNPSSYSPPMFTPSQAPPIPGSKWNSSQFEALTYPKSEWSLPTPPAFSSNLPTEIKFPMLEEYPERIGEPECDFFMRTGDCKFKSNCKFHHPKSHITKAVANQYSVNDKGLPLRPDQPICTYYHRYGICKYGPSCKYDHPTSHQQSF